MSSTSVSVTMPTSRPPAVTGSALMRLVTMSWAASSTGHIGAIAITGLVMTSEAVSRR